MLAWLKRKAQERQEKRLNRAGWIIGSYYGLNAMTYYHRPRRYSAAGGKGAKR